jgi:phosphonate transport system ATP-binding protein
MPNQTPSYELALRGVGKCWGAKHTKRTLSNINLVLRPNDRVALIGPSGAGKSTLIQIMAAALRASEGVVEINGQAVDAMSWQGLQRFRASCRIVEQHSLLVQQSSVHQNVVAGLLPGYRWHQALWAALVPVEKERVFQLLTQLGIGDYQWTRAGDLSGGQMQRVVIARALINHPQILLADEPTASLDPNTARAVTQQIVDMAKRRAVSLVFCTHWFDIVRADCTRVIALRDGEMVFDHAPADVSPAMLDQLYQGSNERH